MATRLYPHAAGAPGPVITPSASWDVTSGYSQRLLTDTLDSDTALSTTVTNTKAVAGPINVLVVQFLVLGLDAQTISGNLKGQFRCNESNAAADAHVQTIVRVVDPATMTVRGTLLAATASVAISASAGTDNYEMATTLTNRKVPSGWSGSGVSLSSVDAEAGDALVVELGVRCFDVAATSRTFTFSTIRATTSSDYAEDETSTGTANCWLEFSHNFTLSPRASTIDPNTEMSVSQRFPSLGGSAPPTTGQTWPRGMGA